MEMEIDANIVGKYCTEKSKAKAKRLKI